MCREDLYPELSPPGAHVLSLRFRSHRRVGPGSSDSSTNKMRRRTEKLGALLPRCVPASSSQRGLFMKASTYLAKIAVLLQEAPGKMLTFSQLMDRLTPLIRQDRKSVENSIRVCLSSCKCFVKIPVVPDSPDSKRNYWKLDPSQITEKMVRRHFQGILQLFPELKSKVGTDNKGEPETRSARRSPVPAASRDVQIRCEVKFSGPFSIESLLKRDSPPTRASAASPLSTRTLVGTSRSFRRDSEEPLLLPAAARSSSICSTGGSKHHGLIGAAQPINKKNECTRSSFPLHTRASVAPYFTIPQRCYVTYSVPTFAYNAPRFRL
uniref:Fork-head domain-containing protein n=2 Tax=Gasterosteus aculeatus aculeatus TaxID=481459 RepID=A0AAQ4S009_GASAC|nr:forkhead box protein Q1 isoform X1 [Gasterosteus aculeatus aculeatus]